MEEALSSIVPSSELPDEDKTSIPTTSLFTTTLSYITLSKRYREPLLAYLRGKNTVTASVLIGDLLASAQLPLEKTVLLEAMEWALLKLGEHDEQMRAYRREALIAQSFKTIGPSPKSWEAMSVPQTLTAYQNTLKTQLQEGISPERTSALQQEHDLCLILWSALSDKVKQAKHFDEKRYFKTLTEQQIYQNCQQPLFQGDLKSLTVIKSPGLKSIWRFLWDAANARLPLSVLENNRKTLEAQRKTERSRYQDLLSYWQKALKLTPQQRWKMHYLYNRDRPSAIRFGGKSGITIQSFFHSGRSLESRRYQLQETLEGHISGLLGSTYFSNDKPLEAENTLCLDANYQQGETGATADGYGHFGTLAENRKVQQAAYRTVKLMTRYVACYLTPESLMADFAKLFVHVGQAVKHSFLHPEEAGTASCVVTRVFVVNAQRCLSRKLSHQI